MPIWPSFEVNGLDWQCCLAGTSNTAPRIFILSIVLDAEYLSYVKFIATFALTFFGYIISVLVSGCDAVKSFFSACLLSHRLSRGPFTCLSGRHSQSVSDYILVSPHLKGVASYSRQKHGWFYTSQLFVPIANLIKEHILFQKV